MSDPAAILARSGRFHDIESIGRGATGHVFRAFDDELGRVVAIKTLVDPDPDGLLRLKREFRSLRGVSDPNLVQLFDLSVGDGDAWFTMECVEGADFVTHVRGEQHDSSATILERFLRAAPQLVRGIRALHGAGHLHRDIKPSNVLVDGDGRVVILDLDLAADLGAPDPVRPGMAFAGTVAYMAPEQLLAGALDTAADWYSAGVLLYESLAGALPVSEEATHWISERSGIVPLRARIPDVPVWLAYLVESLMSTDPAQRPNGDALLDAFANESIHVSAREARSDRSGNPPIGRADELAGLGAAYASVETAIVVVRGASGVGKTELVRAFLRAADEEARGLGPVVFSGRCNPQESVAYQAIDPIIDALSRELTRRDGNATKLPAAERSAVVKLFPVLERILPEETAPAATEPSDVVETRRIAIQGIRRLLRDIAQDRRLVFWLDDVQWSDRDSGLLLAELLRPPDAPSVLLVCACRNDEDASSPLIDALDALVDRVPQLERRTIDLEPLDRLSAAALAGRLAERTALRPEQLEAIVAESQGSPFLIGEMVKRLLNVGATELDGVASLDLTNALRDRVSELDPDERELLDLVCLCGQPIERRILLEAAGVGGTGLPLIARLEGRSLVRIQIANGRPALLAYHDRISETLSRDMPDDRRAELHGYLARRLELEDDCEPERLAHHFAGAGDLQRAAAEALTAARRAADAFAFVHAAELYRRSRVWDPRTTDWCRSLMADEAACRAGASFFLEAAALYLEASSDAPPLESLDLRRHAVENLLAGGNVDDGMEALRALLDELGLPYPASPRRALLGSLWKLARLFRRGIEPTGTGPGHDALEGIRIDTCFAAGKSLVDMDSFRGTFFSITGLERALSAGDRYRSARSLSIVGGFVSLIDPLRDRGADLMARAHALAEELDAPELLGTLAIAEGQVLMLRGRWAEARKRSGEGVRLLSEECRGHAFECNIGRGNVLRSLEEIGEDMDEIADRARQLYDAAVSAANIYAETAALQHLSFAALARDDDAEARALAARSLSLWDRGGFHLQHLYTARAVALCDLYEGRPGASRARFQAFDGELRRSGLMRVPLVWVDVHALSGQLAVASAAEATGSEREALLREAERHARPLGRESRPDARASAHLIRAGIETLRGRTEEAIQSLARGAEACRAGSMPLRAACVEARKGELEGGEDGRASRDRAIAQIRGFGVESPDRWAAMYGMAFRLDGASPSR